MNGNQKTGYKKRTETPIPTWAYGVLVVVAVVAIAGYVFGPSLLSGQSAGPSTSSASDGSSGTSPPVVTTTVSPNEKTTTAVVVPGTPEAIRDVVVTSSTGEDVFHVGEAVVRELCSHGIKAELVTFLLRADPKAPHPSDTYKGVVVFDAGGGNYKYLLLEAFTPAYALGSTDDPVPAELERLSRLEGRTVKIVMGTEDPKGYCPK